MRVISGMARRTPLYAPDGSRTRPTADMVKEGLFNVLGGRVASARVLDLFCGSGAIGVEALSRGAKEAWFVDEWAHALDTVKTNLERTKLSNPGQLVKLSVARAIEQLSAQGRRFDIVFMDPNYDEIDTINHTLQDITDTGIMEMDGILIVEIEKKLAGQVNIPKFFEVVQVKDYGRTRLLFCEYLRDLQAAL